MTHRLNRLLVLLLIGAAASASAEVPAPVTTTSEHFEVGQVWAYRTRPGEEESRVIVGRIEELREDTIVVHVQLVGVRLRNPAAPTGYASVIGHAPIDEAALRGSVTTLTDEKIEPDGLDEGYRIWLEGYREGQAGVFTIPLSEVVGFIEEAINR